MLGHQLAADLPHLSSSPRFPANAGLKGLHKIHHTPSVSWKSDSGDFLWQYCLTKKLGFASTAANW